MFDQKIDPQAVLAKMQGHRERQRRSRSQLLDDAEIAKDKTLAALVDGANEGRAGRPLARVPRDAAVPDGRGDRGRRSPRARRRRRARTRRRRRRRSRSARTRRCAIERGGVRLGRRVPAGHAVLDSCSTTRSTTTSSTSAARGHARRSRTCKIIAERQRASRCTGMTKRAHDVQGRRRGRRSPTSSARRSARTTTLTFTVGDADADVLRPEGMVVLDPAAKKPTLDFFTTNYDAAEGQALPGRRPATTTRSARYMRNQWNHDHPPTMPGKKVFDALVKTTTRHERARRDARRSGAGAERDGPRPRDRDRRAVSVEGDATSRRG